MADEHNEANTFTGNSGGVVQARNIDGDIHLHTGGRRPHPPVPRELPAATRHFVNRASELDRLNTYLTAGATGPSSVVISAIAGTAGAGKTALALHWAHAVRDRFPDGDLYVNLRGYDADAAVAPGQVLERFLRALNVPAESVPTDIEGQAALYRSAINERRMLIVLDNAASPEQVRPLLPAAPGCLALVTSRSRLSGLAVREGAATMSLELLTEDESLTLLGETIGHDRVAAEAEAAADLVRRCCCLPLALRIVAERAVGAPEWPLAGLVTELAAEKERLDAFDSVDDDDASIRAVFAWSYEALPAGAARMFRLIGLHPGADISLHATAALADTDLPQARRHLRTLVNANLLEQTTPERYRYHDLLRAYASERAETDEPQPERETALDRLFEWYLRTADAAVRRCMGELGLVPVPIKKTHETLPVIEFDEVSTSLEWLDSEARNIIPISKHSEEKNNLEFAWKLPVTCQTYFKLRRLWSDWIETHQIGLSAAKAKCEDQGVGGILNGFGLAHTIRGEHVEALSCFKESRDAWERSGVHEGYALAIHNLGGAYQQLGELETALSFTKQARSHWQETGNRWGQAQAEFTLGLIHRDSGDLNQAVKCFRNSQPLNEEAGDIWSKAVAIVEEARIQRTRQNMDESITLLNQALISYTEIDHQWGIGTTLNELGTVLNDGGRVEEAYEAWCRALPPLDSYDTAAANQVRERLQQMFL